MADREAFWFGAIFAGFASLFLATGAAKVLVQGSRLDRAVATSAVILGSDIHREPGDDGDTWSARIVFRYRAVGSDSPEAPERIADTPTALDASGDFDDARALAERFPVGAEVVAWHVPGGRAFLVREPGFAPYLFMLFPMLHLGVGIGVAVGTTRGWRRAITTITVAWWLVGLAAFAHYLAYGGRMTLLPAVVGGIHCGIGIALAIGWRRAHRP